MKNNFVLPLLAIFFVLASFIGFGYFYFGQNEAYQSAVTDARPANRFSQNAENENSDYVDVTPLEAVTLMEEISDLVIIDVSPDYAGGHLPGSVNYSLGTGQLDVAINNLDPNQPYLVYCHADSASIAGAERLVMNGFTRVYRLAGNYRAWVEAGLPEEISLKPVGDFAGEAVASRSWDGQVFTHRIKAVLPEPASDRFYEGWLVRPADDDFFSTGELSSVNNEYLLEYSENQDRSDHSKVVITGETLTNGLDMVPETHLLEGVFSN